MSLSLLNGNQWPRSGANGYGHKSNTTSNWKSNKAKNGSNKPKFFRNDEINERRDVGVDVDFRQIPVWPTVREVLAPRDPVIESNIISGKYDSVEHYLRVQYHLLRQDFMRPLRRAITSLRSGDTNGIKVYRNVVIKERKKGKTFKYWATISGRQVADIYYEESKLLNFGCLVCLSADKFQTFSFALVGDRRVYDWDQNALRVKLRLDFESSLESIDPYYTYEVIESEAYFTAYRHNLSALKRLDSYNFPLKHYIVDVKTQVSSPPYLTSQTTYDLSHMSVSSQQSNSYSGKRVKLSDCSQWTDATAMGFDDSQYEAFKFALSRKLVLIQGPPGTGKTYIGLKIVETLYKNRNVWNRNSEFHTIPILIVCYTNHALDQFLEGVLEFCKDLARIGGRSQSEKLEKLVIVSIENIKALKDKHIIGMTTTCAAKHQYILEAIGPKIVVIEEAAEVFESHVITSLTKSTEHLILIGDHKQLRPNPADYELTKTHYLDVSLFERLINNGMPFRQLKLQHRMRPEISKLLVPHIYDELYNHECVKHYDNILGVKKNIYFISHKHLESQNKETKSKSNQFEAEFIVRFAKHLLYQSYDSSKITILTLYSAQQLLIQELLEQNHISIDCQNVDGFQGEENEIIIVSFIRSNLNNSIGFLNVSNRVNVALSRAKSGLYCIGNFNFLAKHSRLWKNIRNCLEKTKEIGPLLRLQCPNHPNKVIDVSNVDDFDSLSPYGGCCLPYSHKLQCSHTCSMEMCHSSGFDVDCIQRCAKLVCEHKHTCPLICHYGVDCKPCVVVIVKTVPECNHRIKEICSGDLFCYKSCKKRLSCGHRCERKCGEICDKVCHRSAPKVSDKCVPNADFSVWFEQRFMQMNQSFETLFY